MGKLGGGFKMLRKAGNILLHPVTMALVITLIISLALVPSHRKFKAEIVDQIQLLGINVQFFDDLDGNGYSDKIILSEYAAGVVAVNVYLEPSLSFREWNLRGSLNIQTDQVFSTHDADGDGIKELFVITIDGDSLFLTTVLNSGGQQPKLVSKYLDRLGTGPDTVHLNIIFGECTDLNKNNSKEFIFALNAGISRTPRKIFAYDVLTDTLYSSPPIGYHILKLLTEDINGDGGPEILVNGYASMNSDYRTGTPDDLRCWLIVLDRELRFLFPPVAFQDRGYSHLSTFAIRNGKGYSDIYSVYFPPVDSQKSTLLIRFDQSGGIIRQKEVPEFVFGKIWSIDQRIIKGEPFIEICDIAGNASIYDTNFNLVDEVKVPKPFTHYTLLDIDGDGSPEHVMVNPLTGELVIYRDDPSFVTAIPMNVAVHEKTVFSVLKTPGERPLLFIDTGDNGFLVKYTVNPMYYGRWGMFALVFLLTLGFIYLIQKIQAHRMQKMYDAEKKITELQMKVVRNQMDPHFSMNAINSVIAAVQRKEHEAAAKSLMHFSRMYRDLVLSGDRIDRTLGEELEFVKNYLELEKFRFKNSFDYRFEIDPAVDLSWKIPKMIIQSPVENAVKHGLLQVESGGLLIIRAGITDSELILEIEDNGIGRANANHLGSQGTGMGMKILQEFLELYNKVRKSRIKLKIVDLSDQSGRATGTKLIIFFGGN